MLNTKDWLVKNIITAEKLSNETWDIVSGFTILWNLFDNKICNTKACLKVFDELSDLFGSASLSLEMENAYAFWKNRYVTAAVTNGRFEELFNFEHGAGWKIASKTLIDNNASKKQIILTLLIVIHRLRNNLFHGNKEFQTLNDQVENLDHASQALAAIMVELGIC